MHIDISIPKQTLTLLDEAGELLAQFPVSTAANGVGCEKDSGCTPLGKHCSPQYAFCHDQLA